MLYSRSKDFKFLEDKGWIKVAWCLYHLKIMTYSTGLCQHKIGLCHEGWGWGCLLPSSKCIDYICIHTKAYAFLFLILSGTVPKVSQSKRPLRDKVFICRQRWSICKCQIPSNLIVICKGNVAHCTPALDNVIWMLHLTCISSWLHVGNNFLCYLDSVVKFRWMPSTEDSIKPASTKLNLRSFLNKFEELAKWA